MKKIKLEKVKWWKLMKNALVSTLILAAVALCYGYYLVEKIGDSHKEAKMPANLVAVNTEEKSINVNSEKSTEIATDITPDISKKADDLPENHILDSKSETNATANNSEMIEIPTSVKEQAPNTVANYQAVGGVDAVVNAPCQMQAIYEYGYGYDSVYKDIRFHNHAYYQAEDLFDVYAVDEGIIEKVGVEDNDYLVIIKHNWGKSEYRGLNSCAVTMGQHIKQGEIIASAEKLYYYLYVE